MSLYVLHNEINHLKLFLMLNRTLYMEDNIPSFNSETFGV